MQSQSPLSALSWIHGRPRTRIVFVSGLLLLLLGFKASSSEHLRTLPARLRAKYASQDDTAVQIMNPHDTSLWVNGPPTASFRDNLNPDTKYLTGWSYAGWTNDFISFCNTLYLATITSRVPILPPFPPSLGHIGGDAVFLNWGDIYDLPRLRNALNTPILEWRDVKQVGSSVIDVIGCWSIWATMMKSGTPRGSALFEYLGLAVSFTSMQVRPLSPGDDQTSFWDIASNTFPKGRQRALSNGSTRKFPLQNGTWVPPDEQLVCTDSLYYVGARKGFEWEDDYSPVWRFVARHVHWSPVLQDLVNGYLGRMLNLGPDESIPPMITLHIRRTDFKNACKVPLDECMAPLSAYSRRVEEIKAELLKTRGLKVDRVFVGSDERDDAWWQEVRDLGWHFVDHKKEQTVERHGKWYPALIDAVVQSMGAGFVGTAASTMSLVAARRVEDWNDGITANVRWGRKDADAH